MTSCGNVTNKIDSCTFLGDWCDIFTTNFKHVACFYEKRHPKCYSASDHCLPARAKDYIALLPYIAELSILIYILYPSTVTYEVQSESSRTVLVVLFVSMNKVKTLHTSGKNIFLHNNILI